MRGVRSIVFLTVFALFIAGGMAFAEDQQPATQQQPTEQQPPAQQPPAEQKVTGSFTTSFLSQYIFRGYELSTGSLVIEPSVTLNYAGFSVNLWGNLDTNQTPTQSFHPSNPGTASWNETDLTLSYTYTLDKLSITPGYIWYGTQYTKQTQELFLSLAYDIITKPVLTIYQDIAQNPGTYFLLAFSHSIPVYKEATFDLGASFSYEWGQGDSWRTYQAVTGAYTGPKYTAFHAGMLQGGMTIPVAKNFSVQPVVQWWFPLSSKASETIMGVPYNPNGNVKSLVVYGLNMALNF